MKLKQNVRSNRRFVISALLVASVYTLSACSDDDDDTPGNETAGSETAGSETAGSETAGNETAGNETAENETAENDTVSPSALRARAAINNGYYLSRSEEFDADGSSLGGISYTLNSAERQIESRDIEDETLIESLYKYDSAGDLTAISLLSADDVLAPIGDEIQRVDIQRSSGALQSISVDYLIGDEEDNRTSYTYGSDGRITSTQTLYQETNAIETIQYSYDEDVLISVSGNDIEMPDVTLTSTITRDSQGRVSLVSTSYDPEQPGVEPENIVYLYDQNGNVSEIQIQADDGSINFREVFTYETTGEAIFNLPFYDIYFSR